MKKPITGNAGLMRRINRSLVVDKILREGSISRSEIEAGLGLALPTVVRIVDDLLEEGLVMEVGKGDSSGGRKPVLLEINPNAMYFIGVSIQRKMKVALADAVGNILCRYEEIGHYDNITEDILVQVLGGIERVVAKSGIDESKISNIGIGTPGTMFRFVERINEYPFKHWAQMDTNVWKHSGKFRHPVEFQNVAKLGALGELRFGYGKREKNFVYVFADYGIGSGIVADGELFLGAMGEAGELGHTVVVKGGKACYCGNRGCLEMYSATPAIARELKRHNHMIGKSMLDAHGSPNFELLTRAIAENDSVARGIMEQAGEMLGIGISNMINMFNPGLVIIGGELAESFPIYVEAAKRSALGGVFSLDAGNISINISKLGDDSELLGAVALAMTSVYRGI